MFLSNRLVLSSIIFAIVLIGSANKTNADTVTLVLTSPVQTGTIGSTLLFTGILTNTGTEPVVIDSSGLIVDPFTTTRNLVFSAGAVNLVPGQSTGVIPLFTVTLDPTLAVPSTIVGFFSVGQSSTPGGEFAIQEFSINLAIPEPATLMLLGTGLAGVAIKLRNRVKAKGGQRIR